MILAGPGDFLPVIFVLIAIASGIINFIKERKAAVGKVDLDPGDWEAQGNPDSELQSEIDAFLQEVSPGNSEPSRPQRQGNPQQRRRKKVESDEEAERKRQVRARREHERRQLEEDQKRKSLRTRHLDTSELGEVSHRHVENAVEDRHLRPIDDNLPARQPRRSSFEAPAVKTDLQFQASSVVAILREPGGIRNAVLLSEIIGPPLASRTRRKR